MNAAEGQAPGPVSRATAWKIVISVIAVVGAVGTLLYFSAVPEMAYYKHVDEVLADTEQYRGKRLKVHGHVVEGSILQKPGTLEYKFRLESRKPRAPGVIEAEYKGLVPDNFQSGSEVVAKGVLDADNRLMIVPDGIDAKCPSKYEAEQPKYTEAPAAGSAAAGSALSPEQAR
jgi:cytochrome c-type biogenesis protein CcmE